MTSSDTGTRDAAPMPTAAAPAPAAAGALVQATTLTSGSCLWGKSRGLDAPYPLLGHLLDTAAAAAVLLAKAIPASLSATIAAHMRTSVPLWRQAVLVLAGCHDIGKASAGFQNQDRRAAACPSWLRGHNDMHGAGRHDKIGALLAWDRFDAHPARYRAAQIIGGHHGRIPRLDQVHLRAWGGAAMADDTPPQELLEARDAIWEQMTEAIGELPDVDLPTPAASIALAVVVAADWIASSAGLIAAQQQRLPDPPEIDPSAHYRRALELAEGHVNNAGLSAASPRPAATPRTLIGGDAAAWTPLQASIADAFKPTSAGLAVVLAPTGEGKTEAGLLAAEMLARACDRHGFFFAMPTVATAEGLHERIQRYISSASADDTVRRVHSQAALRSDTTDASTMSEDSAAQRAAAAWMTGTRKTMLAPYGVGTIDQVLLGALKANHAPLRMLAAAAGSVIVDEAHALDPYMRTLLCRAVEWLAALATPVVVLSATMPSRRTRELFDAYQRGAGHSPSGHPTKVGYPGWAAWTPTDGWSGSSCAPRRRWRARLNVVDVPAVELTDRMAREAADVSRGRCVLVVRSTVRAAQETHDALAEHAPDLVCGETLEILHSRMPHRNRHLRSEQLLRRLGPDTAHRPVRLVVVATQVVEQSFDVDFDLVITDPAPAAALLQRLGRVRRHRPPADGEAAEAIVVWPRDRDGTPRTSSPIYSKADLLAARAWLCSAETTTSVDVNVPDEVPEIVERADIETADSFVFDTAADDAEDATLAQLARVDADKALGHRWAIPFPAAEAPLADLTGALDSEDTHPGTRHQAHSVLVIPASSAGDAWRTSTGTVIDQHPRRTPDRQTVCAVFDDAVPVSYPNSEWADSLPALGDGWDRTPLAGALLLDVNRDEPYGGYTLRLCPRAGLSINKAASL